MTIAVLLSILAAIVATIWLSRDDRRRRRGKLLRALRPACLGPAGQLDVLRLNRQYWGVEIRSGVCKAAKELVGRRFPFAEAPCLPLAECGAHQCSCNYVGLWERRRRHRRIQADRRQSIRYAVDNPDRRSHKERRKADIWGNVTS
jgi:hypothetical protein